MRIECKPLGLINFKKKGFLVGEGLKIGQLGKTSLLINRI